MTEDARYSGEKSIEFWRGIANIQDRQAHDLIYIAGCALQDHEKRVLQMIRVALDVEER